MDSKIQKDESVGKKQQREETTHNQEIKIIGWIELLKFKSYEKKLSLVLVWHEV